MAPKSDPKLVTILDRLEKSTQKSQAAFIASQAAFAAAIDKIANASYVLKPTQPHFNPHGNIEDYWKYKDWRRQFNLFIKRVPNDKWDKKSEWLKNSVKGKAFLLISSCSDDQEGYEGALALLDKKYQQTDYIREAMFEFLYSFKIQTAGKNYSNVADQLLTFGNYLKELMANHGMDAPNFVQQFLSHIVMKGLPSEVKKQFTESCDHLYPKIDTILSKTAEVINTLNYFSTDNYIMPTSKNNSNKNKN